LIDDLQRRAARDGGSLAVFVFRRHVDVPAGITAELHAYAPEAGFDLAALALDAQALDRGDPYAERRGFAEERGDEPFPTLGVGGAIADALAAPCFRQAPRACKSRDDRRAGRRDELPLSVADPHRETAQQLDGRGSGDGERAVAASHHSAAEGQWRDDEVLDPERVDRPGRADDVDDR